MPPRKPVEPDAPEVKPEPEVDTSPTVDGETDLANVVSADGTSTGPIPYTIDGRLVSQHEYAERQAEEAHAKALADLQAAAEGRGETYNPPPEED
jgi:hypothetical protein